MNKDIQILLKGKNGISVELEGYQETKRFGNNATGSERKLVAAAFFSFGCKVRYRLHKWRRTRPEPLPKEFYKGTLISSEWAVGEWEDGIVVGADEDLVLVAEFDGSGSFHAMLGLD